MNPAKTEFTAEEINEKLIDAINTVKSFKKLLSIHLRMWKCYFTFDELRKEHLKNDQINKFLKAYNLSLTYYTWSTKVTLFSNLDPELKVSEEFFENLLTDEAHTYFERTHKEYKNYVTNTN